VSERSPGDSLGRGSVTAYRVNNNQADKIIETTTKGYSPCQIAINPKNSLMVVSNYNGEIGMVFPLLPDGTINEVSQTLYIGGKSIDTIRQREGHLHSSVFTNNGKYCYMADLGADRIHIFSYEEATNTLKPLKPSMFYPITVKGSGPRHMVISKNDKFLFVLNELNSTITTYAISKDGSLETKSSVSSLPPGFNQANLAADIHMSKDQKRIYVSNRGADNIGAFNVNSDGKLTLIGHYDVKGKTPRNFAITSDEQHILVANQDTNSIVLMKVNKDGSLTGIKSFEVLTPVCIEEI
jgi:6-phosphogluconolactonase